MKRLRRAWRRFLGAITLRRNDSDLADELASHMEMQVEDNLRAGMDPAEARRQARLKFGSVESAKESYRDQRGLPWIEGLFTDLRYALRGLLKTPGFTLVAVLTLALGIGANTAVFSLVDQVLLDPRGISNPARVIAVKTRYGKLNLDLLHSSSRVLVDLHDNPQVFESAALMSEGDVNYTNGGDPQRLRAALVTSEWFDVFGAKPRLGRVFRKEEDQPNANRVAVLSHAAWMHWFGGDPAVLGRAIDLNQVTHRVVGVMPQEFRWPRQVDVWMPIGLPARGFALQARFRNESFTAVARTRPEVFPPCERLGPDPDRSGSPRR